MAAGQQQKPLNNNCRVNRQIDITIEEMKEMG